jgi:hypothetical protein
MLVELLVVQMLMVVLAEAGQVLRELLGRLHLVVVVARE